MVDHDEATPADVTREVGRVPRWGFAQLLLRRLRTLEIFDRSMTLAAEVFTAVFPIMIIVAVWIGDARLADLAASIGMPEQTRAVLDEALTGRSFSTFGVVGVVVVIISATSLSRALTRSFAAIWQLARPYTGVRNFWRWVGAVGLICATLVLSRLAAAAEPWPPEGVWSFTLSFLVTVTGALLVPWLLLRRVVPARLLLPGALVFAGAVTALRPLTHLFMADALEDSADQYGTLGVAFTYIAFLYAWSFLLLFTTLLGQLVATDPGRLGQWIRRGAPAVPGSSDDHVTSSA